MSVRILLPAEFQDIHRRAALAWVRRGHEFKYGEWQVALRAFDLLKEAAVATPSGIQPFPAIYYRYVDEPHSDDFIRSILKADQVESVGTRAWARIAQTIPSALHQAGLAPPNQPAARLLVAYCLYWWYAFAHGYIFEVEILRDLTESGVQFASHDLTIRQERMSPWDLEILGFRGDIKRSLSFLQTSRGRRLPYVFYITRLTGASRTRTLVVLMRQVMWEVIDGETILTSLDDLADALPDVAHMRISDLEVIVADYTLWKKLVRRRQSEGK